jgi:AcrR family transcriptional regulator
MPASAPASTSAPARPVADKRAAILSAALRLIARSGLHDTPIAAVAQEAGVGAGTVYRYFPSKEAMINALYLELLDEQDRAVSADVGLPAERSADAAPDTRSAMWRAWSGLARWHLDRPEASSVLHQCRASGILSAETREHEQRTKAAGLVQFREAIAHGHLRDLHLHVFWALFTGPITALAEARSAGELDVTDAVLRATFDGVCRSVLPTDAAP